MRCHSGTQAGNPLCSFLLDINSMDVRARATAAILLPRNLCLLKKNVLKISFESLKLGPKTRILEFFISISESFSFLLKPMWGTYNWKSSSSCSYFSKTPIKPPKVTLIPPPFFWGVGEYREQKSVLTREESLTDSRSSKRRNFGLLTNTPPQSG